MLSPVSLLNVSGELSRSRECNDCPRRVERQAMSNVDEHQGSQFTAASSISVLGPHPVRISATGALRGDRTSGFVGPELRRTRSHISSKSHSLQNPTRLSNECLTALIAHRQNARASGFAGCRAQLLVSADKSDCPGQSFIWEWAHSETGEWHSGFD